MENTDLQMEEELQVIPQEKLYDQQTIMIATLLGGPLAAGYLLYKNYNRMDEPEEAKNSLVWAFLIMAVLFGSLIMLPEATLDKIPNFVIPWASAGAAYYVANKLQGEVLAYHKAQGGAFYSRWNAVWLGILAAVTTMVLLLPLAMF